MLEPVARSPVTIHWRDREGNEGAQRIYHEHETAPALIEAGAAMWIEHCQALSDGAVTGYTVLWQWEDKDAWILPETSDVYRYGSLYYRNTIAVERLLVPSFRYSLLEIGGSYGGIRVDALRADVALLLDALQPVLEFVCTPEGDPMPLEYLVGGLLR